MADQERLLRTPGAFSFISYDILATDSLGKYVEPEDGRAIYTLYTITNRYVKDLHKYYLSIASESGIPEGQNTAAIVQLSKPTLVWICSWVAEKYFVKPEIPNPTSSDVFWELLDEFYTLDEITVGSDGDTPLYRIGGTYVYGNLRPSPSTINNTQFPRIPWLDDVYSRVVDPSQLRDGLSEIAQRTLSSNPGGQIPPFRVS